MVNYKITNDEIIKKLPSELEKNCEKKNKNLHIYKNIESMSLLLNKNNMSIN